MPQSRESRAAQAPSRACRTRLEHPVTIRQLPVVAAQIAGRLQA